MSRVKYGKIRKSEISNIFATTIQLVIRMKQLIEGQFENFNKNPNSDVIPAIIDVYEQLKSKQEYLDINPFIHAMKNEFQFNNIDAKFAAFFASVICSIDFSNMAEILSINRQICFTSLKDKTNQKPYESYIFDISLKRGKKLSEMIQNQYEFSSSVIYEPNFLFFSPKDDATQSISIDDKISISNSKYTSYKISYYLSIIVVKKIRHGYFNHFVLYIGAGGWIKIEDEDISSISKENVFMEVLNEKIELFGYCVKPSESIVTVDTLNPTEVENYDYDKLKQEQTKQKPKPTGVNYFDYNKLKQEQPKPNPPPLNNQIPDKRPSTNPKSQNTIYTVTFIQFEYKNKSYKVINEKEFKSSDERDEYLDGLERDSKDKFTQLFFDNGTGCSATNYFDENETDITVYSVPKSMKSLFKPPFIISFRQYFNDEDDVIDDDELETWEDYFHPDTTIQELYSYCYYNFPGKPKRLYLKNKKISNYGTKIFYDQLITNSYSPITTIIKPNEPTIIYFLPSKKQTDTNSNFQVTQSKPATELKPSNSLIGTKETKPTTENDNKMVIMRPLRSCIYDEKNQLTLKKVTITNRSNIKGKLDEIMKYILTSVDSLVVSYCIEFKEDYVVKYFDRQNTLIQDLPPYFNVQIKPHKGLPCRICTLYRSPVFNNVIDINKECFSFAVRFYQNKTVEDIIDSVINYLYKGKDERVLLSKKDYIPSLYFFANNRFYLIENYDEIQRNEFKPIFVMWHSTSVYDYIMKLIQKHLKEQTLYPK